jgi:O-antigen/teichoic acid export membrane protein
MAAESAHQAAGQARSGARSKTARRPDYPSAERTWHGNLVADTDSPGRAQVLKRSRASLLSRLPRQAGRRLGWGLADQAVSSLTNFAVSIYVAKSLGATDFGAFSLAYVTYGFVLNASRGLATDPLLVRYSGAEIPAWRKAVSACTGTALGVGLITGLLAVGVAALLHGTPQRAFLALGITLPGLMLQDSWRFAFFAIGRGSRAFLNDLIWALTLAPALLALRVTHHQQVFWFVLVWGASATVAACIGSVQARIIPRLTKVREWLHHIQDLGFRYLAENTLISGASQLRVYGIGLILGLAAVGYVQVASMLMGPFLVIFMGISLVVVPEAARVLQKHPRHLRRFCGLVSIVLSLAALAWGGLLLLVLPTGLGFKLVGPLWLPAYALIIPVTIQVVGSTLSCGATAGLHALGAARRSLRAQIFASVAFVGGGLAGAYFGGTLGTMRGTAAATMFGAVVWWWQLHLGLRESGTAAARYRFFSHKPSGPRHVKPAGPGRNGRSAPTGASRADDPGQ